MTQSILTLVIIFAEPYAEVTIPKPKIHNYEDISIHGTSISLNDGSGEPIYESIDDFRRLENEESIISHV